MNEDDKLLQRYLVKSAEEMVEAIGLLESKGITYDEGPWCASRAELIARATSYKWCHFTLYRTTDSGPGGRHIRYHLGGTSPIVVRPLTLADLKKHLCPNED